MLFVGRDVSTIEEILSEVVLFSLPHSAANLHSSIKHD